MDTTTSTIVHDEEQKASEAPQEHSENATSELTAVPVETDVLSELTHHPPESTYFAPESSEQGGPVDDSVFQNSFSMPPLSNVAVDGSASLASSFTSAVDSNTGASMIPQWMEEELLVLPKAFLESPVKVWVMDPKTEIQANSLGIKTSYTTYQIHVEYEDQPEKTECDVRRRFSEFEALYKMLRALHKGYFIPALPDKTPLEGKASSQEFVAQRKAELQGFMRIVAGHPVLRESEPFRVFVTTQGDLLHSTHWKEMQKQMNHAGDKVKMLLTPGQPAPSQASDSSDSPSKASSTFAPSWKSWVKQTIAPPKKPLSEEEMYLRKMKELLSDLERLLQLSSDSARMLVQHLSNLGMDFYELGRNFAMMGRFEEAVREASGTASVLGQQADKQCSDLRKAAVLHKKQQTVWQACSLKAVAALLPLHDYYMLMPEAVAALEERENLLATIWMLEDDLMARQQQLLQAHSGHKSLPGFTNRDKRIHHISSAIQATEEQIKSAKELYETIKERNQSELVRLSLNRQEDFRQMMVAFCNLNASVTATATQMWSMAAQEYMMDK